MSTRDALIQELMKQPEEVLREVRRYLASVVEHQTHNGNGAGATTTWPEGYFQRTAGAFANEQFERPSQLPFENREEW
ncbi:MAG: hypothetical protein HY298_10175 [Verrucomicrobia bacterium]|nr:hypothetical protein [Verrucomicrobiota bacterium]